MSSNNVHPTEARRARSNRAPLIVYGVAGGLALIGLAETIYLTALHLAGVNVVCIASSGCSQVLRSVYASFHGIPLAGLGALGYFAVFSAATFSLFGYRRAPQFLAGIVGTMFSITLWLLYLQAYVLHAFCDYCLLSASLIFLLAGLLILVPRRA